MREKDKTNSLDDQALLLKAIFNNAVDGIITINDRGIVESINPAAAKLFSYTPIEVVGNNIKMLMPEPYHSQHDGYIHNYKTTRKKKIIGIGREVKGRRKDGTTFPFFLSVSEVKMENRVVFTGFIHDISEIKSKEKELEESKNRLNAIFETAVDGIIIINNRGLIQMINPAVISLFGYEESEMLGNNIKMLMPEPDHSAHDQYLSNYQESRDAKIIGIGREVIGKRKDGSTFYFSLGVSEVIINKKEVIYTGIIHDLSAQKKVEQQIKKLNESLEQKIELRTEELSNTVNKLLLSNKKLETEIIERQKVEEELKKTQLEIRTALEKEKELNELKSRFVSMASHEFRTPLSTILSSTALIGRYTLTEQQDKRDKHIKWIKSAVSNLTGILNDFLSLSKLEEGKVEVKNETFEWTELCDEVSGQLEGMLKKGQTIIQNHNIDTEIINLDKRLLKNILFNLLSNAIKYSPENSAINCNTSISNNRIKISIKDEGIGIPKKDQEYLFTRFFRANNVSNIQGTGLGLNIVKRYVELLNGQISFESEEEKGTTFFIDIPLKNEA